MSLQSYELPQHIANRRSEQKNKQDRNKKILKGIGLASVAAVAVIGTSEGYIEANKALDQRAGISPSQLSALEGRLSATPASEAIPNDADIKYVTFQFKAEKDNTVSAAAAMYAPNEDQTEASERISQYLPAWEQAGRIVHSGETITFAINTNTHEIIPKDQAPLLPSVNGQR